MAETQDNTSNETSKPPLTEAEKLVQEAMAEAQASLNEIKQATEADAEADSDSISMPDFSKAPVGESMTNLDLLSDVELNVTVELGRTQMLVEDVLKLGDGSVVELDKLAGDPVDVYVNNRLIARGEVLVLNDNFCIRISEIVADLEEQAEAAAEQQAQHR